MIRRVSFCADPVECSPWRLVKASRMYKTFAHTADTGLHMEADDLNGLFVEAGRGLFSLIVAKPETIQPRMTRQITVPPGQPDYMLVDWLNELLFAFDKDRLLLWHFDVSIGPAGLRATAGGEPYDAARHELEHEVKAITYHGLVVESRDGKWIATVIVDI